MTPQGDRDAKEAGRVAVVLKGYPRLSETFIAQELLALQRKGLRFSIHSLRHPTDKARHPIHAEITAPLAYLPEYLHQEPGRVWRAWRKARRLPGYPKARAAFLKDWRRDPTPNRGRRFGQACVLAAELPEGVGRLYAHFLHTPASVARYTALMRGLPWSCSAHAKDIWTSPEWEKREKLAELDWLATCTRVGAEHLAALSNDPGKVKLIYHGLDLARFPRQQRRPSRRDGSGADGPVIILSVGRLVEKKGYDLLLEALAALPAELQWRFLHIGGGELSKPLKAQAERLGLAERIDWRGAQPQEAVKAALAEADLFVLPSRVARSGDRDGLPNVLMEAQSQGLACLSSAVSAIPELIEEGRTGLLVPPDDRAALTQALERLIREPSLRESLGRAGEERLRRDFALGPNIAGLAALFGLKAEEDAA
jgi:glycosyltransferase involved in cell wall biosynthesis